MTKSKINYYFQRYLACVERYGTRAINQCYAHPSIYKRRAEHSISAECYHNGGWAYSVITYNAQMFTCGYLYQKVDPATGEYVGVFFKVHTPTDSGEIQL